MDIGQHINTSSIMSNEITFADMETLNTSVDLGEKLFLCLNIWSLNANFEKLELFIEKLSNKPQVIV